MQQIAIKIGNSVGVVIPQPLRRKIGLKPGDKVEINEGSYHDEVVIRKNGKISAKRSSITPEFMSWLESFNKRYSSALRELAKK